MGELETRRRWAAETNAITKYIHALIIGADIGVIPRSELDPPNGVWPGYKPAGDYEVWVIPRVHPEDILVVAAKDYNWNDRQRFVWGWIGVDSDLDVIQRTLAGMSVESRRMHHRMALQQRAQEYQPDTTIEQGTCVTCDRPIYRVRFADGEARSWVHADWTPRHRAQPA